MKKNAIASALIAASLGTSSFVMADDGQEIQSLKERLAKLEAKQAKKDALSAEWTDRVTLSGVVEVEASYSDPDSGSSESDLAVATVELGLEAAITDDVSANIILLHEEDDTDLELDVATLSYTLGESGFSFVVGQDYQPFGAFETNQVGDTLALEIGEARETAFAVNYESGLFAGSLYVFNGDVDDGNNTIENVGARAGLSNETFAFGVDYISNIGDSDAISGSSVSGLDADGDAVGGAAVNASVAFGTVTLIAEYLTALEEFTDARQSEPEAFQLEAAIEWGAFTYAVSYEETDEALFLELPEERVSFGVSTEMLDGVGLALQYFRDSDYSVSDGGTGGDTDNLVLQLAAEF